MTPHSKGKVFLSFLQLKSTVGHMRKATPTDHFDRHSVRNADHTPDMTPG